VEWAAGGGRFSLLVGSDVIYVGEYMEPGNELFAAARFAVGRSQGEEVPGAGVASGGEASGKGARGNEVSASDVVGEVVGSGATSESAWGGGLRNPSIRVPGVAPAEYELPCYVSGGFGGCGEGGFNGSNGKGVFVPGVFGEFPKSEVEGGGEVTGGAAFI